MKRRAGLAILLITCGAWVLASGPAAAAAGSVGDVRGVPLLSGDVELTVFVPGDPDATADLQRVLENVLAAGRSEGGMVADIDLRLPTGAVLQIAAMPGFAPPPLPGFGAMYGAVRAVSVDVEGQQTLEPGGVTVAYGDWIGLRTRFSTVLMTGIATVAADVSVEHVNQPVITLQPNVDRLKLRLFAGPVENEALRAADPILANLLFAALWEWLRWLCFGMLWLLTTIDTFVGEIGWSIVLLSVAVKFLMLPLTQYADSLQASVNRTQALLQPRLDEIKRNYKGEEAHERTLAAYKECGVNPLYTLKSLVGFLIQIPIFIAAFDMLGENIALDGASFWWIEDLAEPDHIAALPLVLPFFGGYLNILPVLMTAVTLLTSWLQRDPHLTPELLHAQRLRLYLMAGAFFMLFYTFPAGMVLYWTTNNVLHLMKITLWPSRPPPA